MPVWTKEERRAYRDAEIAAGRDPYRTGQVRLPDGKAICGAKNREALPCDQDKICRNGRCRMHNGQAARGIAASQYKHGRYSRHVPTRLLERYLEAVTDPELLNLSEEIALLDGRIADVLSRVDSGESGALWRELGKTRRAFLAAQRSKDQEKMEDALLALLAAVGRGQADFEAWAEIVELLERRRRLVESEQKRRVQMHLLVRVEEAVGSMETIADAVRDAVLEHVDDAAIRRRILRDVQSSLDRYLAGSVQQAVIGGD